MRVDIRISKKSRVPMRQQIAAQIEFLIATGKLKAGDSLPSVRALARQLRIHHNTVSQAYQDVASVHLLSSRRGSRLVVRTAEGTIDARPDLDDLINQTIRNARQHGFSLRELSARVRERLIDERPDHVLALSFDAGMRRLLRAELQEVLKCSVKVCSPEELTTNPDLALGALVVAPPGVLPTITQVLPKNRPTIPIQYSSAEAHLERANKLIRPSILIVASVSEHFMKVARGLLGPVIGNRHTLVNCLLTVDDNAPIPTGDLLFCDTIVFAGLDARRRNNAACYHLVSRECLRKIAAAIEVPDYQNPEK